MIREGAIRHGKKSCAMECIGNVDEGVGCDEYITQRHGKFCQNKSGERSGGRRLTGCGFGGHFTRIVSTRRTPVAKQLVFRITPTFHHSSLTLLYIACDFRSLGHWGLGCWVVHILPCFAPIRCTLLRCTSIKYIPIRCASYRRTLYERAP